MLLTLTLLLALQTSNKPAVVVTSLPTLNADQQRVAKIALDQWAKAVQTREDAQRREAAALNVVNALIDSFNTELKLPPGKYEWYVEDGRLLARETEREKKPTP